MIVDTSSQIVKAEPGWFVVNDYEPTDGKYGGYYTSPIIAWYIRISFTENILSQTGEHFKSVEPILCDGAARGDSYSILRPDGLVEVIGVCTCNDISEYEKRAAAGDWG